MRPEIPPKSICKKSLKIYDQFFGHCDTEEDFIKASEFMDKKLGEEKASQIEIEHYVFTNLITGSNECANCDLLDDDEYHEIRDARMSKEGSA